MKPALCLLAPLGPAAPPEWGATPPHALSGEHVVVSWGDDGEVAEADVAALVAAMDLAWDVYVDDLGHPPPVDGALDVVVGDTGGPSTGGAAGVFTVGEDGEPLVVIAAAILDQRGYAAVTGAHELYHVVQYASLAYREEGVADWFWEASATWASGQVFPGEPLVWRFLYAAAFQPHLPWDAYAPVGDGSLLSLRAYGAFVLPQHLSEHTADPGLLRDAWEEADGEDPLAVIDGLLAARGADLLGALGDFAAANATWDYADGEGYADHLRDHEWLYASEDARVALTLDLRDDGAWAVPPDALRPQRAGTNLVEIVRPDAGLLTLAFSGDPVGSAGSASRFAARVVRALPEGPEVSALALEGGAGEVTVEVSGRESAVYLALAALSEERVDGERFGYGVSARWAEAEDGPEAGDTDPGGEAPRACACASGGSAPGGWLPVALVLAARWRLRRARVR